MRGAHTHLYTQQVSLQSVFQPFMLMSWMDGDVDDLKEQGSVTNQTAHGNNGLAFHTIRIRFHEASLKCDK